MTGQVVTLSGIEIASPGKPSADLVLVLEDMLERARSGEIIGVVCAVSNSDGSVGRWRSGTSLDTYSIIGELETIKVSLALDKLGK